ncbi:MAG: AIR synthase-related protein [Flavonifractor plautii]
MVDTYWSDHCRHTTFSTHLDRVEIRDPAVKAAYRPLSGRPGGGLRAEKAAQRPQTLMDLATIGAKMLKKRGLLPIWTSREEINACSIHVTATGGRRREQDWLLMFKNETHNHPTEIEPFGGAATCIGGCYPRPAVRPGLCVSGHARHRLRRPPTPLWSRPWRASCPSARSSTTAAAGYSSYGNQIGLATGHVAEVYHDGYVAKHLEMRRGGGRRSGCQRGAGACLPRRTWSSCWAAAPAGTASAGPPAPPRATTMASLDTMASEVQKGNAPEERKLQRLFRNPQVTRMIKRCNDFGAGGVSVAIGELADGLRIDLDAVRKKYDGLDGTELAISESQERMAVVVAPDGRGRALSPPPGGEPGGLPGGGGHGRAPHGDDLEGPGPSPDLSRAFLNTNGAAKHALACPCPQRAPPPRKPRSPPPLREHGRQPEVRLPPGPGRAV